MKCKRALKLINPQTLNEEIREKNNLPYTICDIYVYASLISLFNVILANSRFHGISIKF